ncbi:25288_t:CDS:1 [Dentiscutata erythropus]|uniref:25288_t:CDS:1 n=1 Tax=Dentiscutata erythropus TaxID=1348616 RepID=A0A9N9HCB0_9GLOM|nr:25288_t:CDS:1 [Dentiscutata erythropus]
MANNSITEISQNIINTHDIHRSDPRVVAEFAHQWNQPRYLTGYEVLMLTVKPICINAYNISDPITIDEIARCIWKDFTKPEQRDQHTNIAFRVNELRVNDPQTFGIINDQGSMRSHGIFIEPADDTKVIGVPHIPHDDVSDIFINGIGHNERNQYQNFGV